MVGHSPADDHAGVQVDDGGQVASGLTGAQIGDVSDGLRSGGIRGKGWSPG